MLRFICPLLCLVRFSNEMLVLLPSRRKVVQIYIFFLFCFALHYIFNLYKKQLLQGNRQRKERKVPKEILLFLSVGVIFYFIFLQLGCVKTSKKQQCFRKIASVKHTFIPVKFTEFPWDFNLNHLNFLQLAFSATLFCLHRVQFLALVLSN